MNWTLAKLYLILFGLAFCTSLTITAQTNKVNSSKKDCGDCLYFPICKFDVTKTYGSEEYRGIRNKDESIVWYNCKNGVITKMWDVKQAAVEMDGDGDFYDTYKTTRHEEIILKSNAEKGTSWTYDDWKSDDNSKSIIVKFSIADKLNAFEVNGKKYSDIIKVRKLKCGYGYTQEDVQTFKSSGVKKYQNIVYIDKVVYFGAEDFYYAKNQGLVKQENLYDSLSNEQKAREALIPKPVKITDSNHPLFKVVTSNCWSGGGHYFLFDENGTAKQIKRVGTSMPTVWEAIPSNRWSGKWELIKNGERYFIELKLVVNNYYVLPDDEINFYIEEEGERMYLKSKYDSYYSRRIPTNLKTN